ncbi:MAG: polyisoprenoid-binding protein YceI [Ilumatobacter sp.]|jgi:polyisoprenoid-binding protein YceI
MTISSLSKPTQPPGELMTTTPLPAGTTPLPAGTTPLPAGTWQLDTGATTVNVSVKMLGVFTVPATLAVASGTIEIDANHEVTGVDITVDASSYSSKIAKRNKHVLSSDFLDTDNHATISFRAEHVSSNDASSTDATHTSATYTSAGVVTIKGQSSPVDVVIAGVDVTGDTGSFTATATVDRTAIGVGKLSTLVIGQDLQIEVAAIARRVS